MPKLTDLFNPPSIVIRDCLFNLTHYATSIHPGSLCYVLNENYLRIANNNPNIAGIITYKKFESHVVGTKGLILTDEPKRYFFDCHNELCTIYSKLLPVEQFVDPSASISSTAHISDNVYIGKGVVVEHEAIINEYSYIGDNSYIGERVIIGARGLHNTILDGEAKKVSDLGGVWIGEGCEILAGAIVQKSYFMEFTRIGNGTKVGPMANIGHGAVIGELTLIAGNSQISGFVTIGNKSWIGPSSIIAHGLRIGNNASIKLGSVVVSNVEDNQVVSGNFAIQHSKHLKNIAQIKKI